MTTVEPTPTASTSEQALPSHQEVVDWLGMVNARLVAKFRSCSCEAEDVVEWLDVLHGVVATFPLPTCTCVADPGPDPWPPPKVREGRAG